MLILQTLRVRAVACASRLAFGSSQVRFPVPAHRVGQLLVNRLACPGKVWFGRHDLNCLPWMLRTKNSFFIYLKCNISVEKIRKK